jgi:propionyl-CoA synthetase
MMRKIADGEQYTSPATIDDPAILGEIGEALQGLACARARRE